MIQTLPRGAIEETVREIKKEENPTCKSPTCWDSEPVALSFNEVLGNKPPENWEIRKQLQLC